MKLFFNLLILMTMLFLLLVIPAVIPAVDIQWLCEENNRCICQFRKRVRFLAELAGILLDALDGC